MPDRQPSKITVANPQNRDVGRSLANHGITMVTIVREGVETTVEGPLVDKATLIAAARAAGFTILEDEQED